MVSADFSITFHNESSRKLILHNKWVQETDLDTIIKSAAQECEGGNGIETLQWGSPVNMIAAGDYYGELLYKTEDGKVFGVRIQVPFQMFYMGNPPYYYVRQNDDDWKEMKPEEPYSFDAERLGVNAKVSTTASHTTLAIIITVTDKA